MTSKSVFSDVAKNVRGVISACAFTTVSPRRRGNKRGTHVSEKGGAVQIPPATTSVHDIAPADAETSGDL